MAKFYRNPEEYANEMMKRTEKEYGRITGVLLDAEKAVALAKAELQKLRDNCPHIITYDNVRPTADEPSTRTCRACGFTA